MRNKVLEKSPELRRRILLVTIVAVPLFFLRMTNDLTGVPKLGLLAIGVALAAGLKGIELLQGAPAAGLKRLWVPAACVLVPLTVGLVFSPYRVWALFGEYQRFQGLIPYALIILLGVLVADAFAGRAEQVATALIASAAAAGAYALIQFAGLDPFEWTNPGATSTLGNPNFTGGFLGIALPVVAALFVSGAGRKPWLIAAAVLIGGGWIVTFSQGGWAAGVAGLCITGGLMAGRARPDRRTDAGRARPDRTTDAGRLKLARIAAVVAAALIAAAAVGQIMLGVVAPESPLVPATVRLRGEGWIGAARMAADYPLVGRGPNAYAVEGAHYRTPQDAFRIGYNYPDDPHSVFLSFTTAAGVLGAIGFIGLVLWTVRFVARSDTSSPMVAGFAGAAAAYLVQSLVSIDEISLRLALWVVLGGMVAATLAQEMTTPVSRRARKARRREPLRLPVAVGVTALVAAAAAFWGVNFIVSDAHAFHGSLLAVTGDPEEGYDKLYESMGLATELEYRRLSGLRVGPAAANADNADLYERALDDFSYVEDFPNVSRMAEYARVLRAGADLDESYLDDARAVYEDMARLDPFNPLIRVELSDVLLAQGETERAVDELSPFIEAEPRRVAQLWGAWALAHAALGDESVARDAIDRALEIDADDERALRAQDILSS